MKKISTLICLIFYSIFSFSQETSLEYYLPEGINYNPEIPEPGEFLGHEIGEWHLSHDKLIYYLYHLDQHSDRISIEQYGTSHEGRPLLLLKATSPENQQRLDELKAAHLELSTGMTLDSAAIESKPLVAWLGFSIHGNEASGSNAVPLVAYHLAAATGPEIDSLLSETVVLLDVCLNPDGFQRFASWVNAQRSKNYSTNTESREFSEPWPGGRTNHYWFDLNRDWILLTQPETKARMKVFNDWKPNIVTDHHEMRSNATFFFQPGVPGRTHPAISQPNISLTQKIAGYHARALDRQKILYFTRESYDDFYPGKGSTYPDLNGGIGILYEQASSRGYARETENGVLYFPTTIKNQLTLALSTLSAARELRFELLKYQNDFYKNALENAKKDANRAYIFGDATHKSRVNALARLLQEHRILLYRPLKNINVNDKTFYPETSFIIPLNQPQYPLIKTFFEKRKTFKDSVFYDVSAWALDLTYNVDFEVLNSKNIESDLAGQQVEDIEPLDGRLPWKSKYAYVIRWNQHNAPAVLYQLLKEEIAVKVSEKEFHGVNGNKFEPGSLVIPLGIQKLSADDIYDKLELFSNKYRVEVMPLETGLTPLGVDLGSPSMEPLEKPEILLLTGKGVNAYEAGEIWHLLDYKMDIPVTLVSAHTLSKIDLSRYNCIIFPDGNYHEISASGKDNVKNWLAAGGTIIAQNDAVTWLNQQNILLAALKSGGIDSSQNIAYADKEEVKGIQNMAGAIFNTRADLTHPLCYGYNKTTVPVFKTSKLWIEKPKVSFNSPVTFAPNPLLAGFISGNNLRKLKNTSGVLVSGYGAGKIIAFSFTPAFRGAWRGTEKFLLNSIYFGKIIETRY